VRTHPVFGVALLDPLKRKGYATKGRTRRGAYTRLGGLGREGKKKNLKKPNLTVGERRKGLTRIGDRARGER